jgi:hypothetical protein
VLQAGVDAQRKRLAYDRAAYSFGAARSHWGSRDDNALEAARDQLKALGGDEGYANYFAFAFRG